MLVVQRHLFSVVWSADRFRTKGLRLQLCIRPAGRGIRKQARSRSGGEEFGRCMQSSPMAALHSSPHAGTGSGTSPTFVEHVHSDAELVTEGGVGRTPQDWQLG